MRIRMQSHSEQVGHPNYSLQHSVTHLAEWTKRTLRLRRPATTPGAFHSSSKTTMRAPGGTKGARQ